MFFFWFLASDQRECYFPCVPFWWQVSFGINVSKASVLSRSLIISLNMCNCGRQLPSLRAGGWPRRADWPESRRQQKPVSIMAIGEIKMRDHYLKVVLCPALSPLLYLQTRGHVWIDESPHTGRHSERQLEQPQYFKPGLMGHVWMQQQGTASSSCPHICWINEEIFPKKRSVHWRMITAAGKDMRIWMCVITHHLESVHTRLSFLREGEEIWSIVEGLLCLGFYPTPYF